MAKLMEVGYPEVYVAHLAGLTPSVLSKRCGFSLCDYTDADVKTFLPLGKRATNFISFQYPFRATLSDDPKLLKSFIGGKT